MGMAASQARLLALTARMHDIELRAQNIESQKLSLATQQDEAYEKYCAAMDATKIQIGISSGLGTSYIDASFQTMCGWHGLDGRARQYSLINNMTGKVLVNQEVFDAFEAYGADKYTFAFAMYKNDNGEGDGYQGQSNWITGGPYGSNQSDSDAQNVGIGENHTEYTFNDGDYSLINDYPPVGGPGDCDLYMTEVEYMVFLDHTDGGANPDSELMAAYEDLLTSSQNNEPVSKRREYLNTFREILYKNHGDEIFFLMGINKNDTCGTYSGGTYYDVNGDPAATMPSSGSPNPMDDPQFKYYLNLWQQIHDAGGCEVMDSQYAGGTEGVEWLNNMISAGLLSIYMFNHSSSSNGFELTTIATSYGDNYLQEVDDEAKIKKAEVEYEHELDVINRKETKFDTQLKKLETEENACKTELDSLKKVKDDNIDRTFNLFS